MSLNCQDKLSGFPDSLETNRARRQAALQGPEAGTLLPEILRVVTQEQEVLHRTIQLAEQHLTN